MSIKRIITKLLTKSMSIFLAISLIAGPVIIPENSAFATSKRESDALGFYAHVKTPPLIKGGDEVHSEIYTIVATTPLEFERGIDFLSKDLEDARSKNNKLVAAIRVLEEGSTREPKSDDEKFDPHKAARQINAKKYAAVASENINPELSAGLRAKSPGWFKRHYRGTFSVIRSLVNGTVMSWVLVESSDVPPEYAVPVGFFVCSIFSGGTMYFNAKVQQIMTSGKYTNKIFKKKSHIQKASLRVEELSKWFLLELGFIVTLKGLLALFGETPLEERDDSFGEVSGATLSAAGFTLLAQGFWDVSIAKETRMALEKAQIARNAKKAHQIQFRSDLVTLAISALAVLAVVMKLAMDADDENKGEITIVDYSMLGFGGLGFINYIRVGIKGRRAEITPDFAKKTGTCVRPFWKKG